MSAPTNSPLLTALVAHEDTITTFTDDQTFTFAVDEEIMQVASRDHTGLCPVFRLDAMNAAVKKEAAAGDPYAQCVCFVLAAGGGILIREVLLATGDRETELKFIYKWLRPVVAVTNNTACDFCNHDTPVVEYQAATTDKLVWDVANPAGAVLARIHLPREWVACLFCRQLIDTADVDGLVDRATAAHQIARAERGWHQANSRFLSSWLRSMYAFLLPKLNQTPQTPVTPTAPARETTA